MKRVVITGIGALSPLGNTFAGTWKTMKSGHSGIRPIDRFDTSDMPYKCGGQLRDFAPLSIASKKDVMRYDPFVLYAHSATNEAAEDATLTPEMLRSASIIIGSSRGGITSIEASIESSLSSTKRPSAYLMAGTTVSMSASYTAARLGIMGNIMGISNACASGTNAIGEAFRQIKFGVSTIALAGGAEAPLCTTCQSGYGVTGALSKSCSLRPFHKERDGFLLSEGAATLVLEEREHAIKRGARIYAEVLGYGNTSDAHHPTKPDPKGQARAMLAAINDAKVKKNQIGFISAHATGTLLGDAAEAEAIKQIFDSEQPAVTALKSMTGHMLAASGALEAAATAMSLREGVITPTTGLEDVSEDGLDIVTTLRKTESTIALSNSFGFGGVNAVLVFSRI